MPRLPPAFWRTGSGRPARRHKLSTCGTGSDRVHLVGQAHAGPRLARRPPGGGAFASRNCPRTARRPAGLSLEEPRRSTSLELEQVWRRARGAIRDVRSCFSEAQAAHASACRADRDIEADIARTYRALDWKLAALSFQLEVLRALPEMKDERRFMLVECAAVAREWEELEHDIALLTLESALFQARSFLDLHMRYSLLLLGERPRYKINRRAFDNALGGLAGQERADALADYYRRRVWAEGRWGDLLLSLRDKIAHADRLYPGRVVHEVELDLPAPSPAVAGLPLERLAMDFSNGIIELLQDTSPILTGKPWPRG